MHALLLVGLLRAGRWQRTRCRTALSIEPAPAGFVEDEDLEPGERCVKALWATDNDSVLLAAGALVSRGNEFDIWLGDSSDSSVGPNRQLRGAIPLALKLLMAYLAIETPATKLRAVPPPPPPRKRLADPLGASSASAAALEALGFCEGSDDDLLVLDDREAPTRLTTLALDGERDAVRALRLLGARRDWPLRENHRCRVVPEVLSPDEVEAFRTAEVQLSDGEDSVDGLPEQHAMLEGSLGARALEIGARIARRAHRHDLIPAAAFLRRYASDDASGRATLGPHFDARPTVATAVVDLDPAAYEGGGYFVQSLPHCSSRRLVPFAADGRDACLHDAELIHGVASVSGCRTSLVVWYHRRDGAEDADADDPDVLFAKAATPPGNSLFLHRAAAAGSANAHALLGTLADARGAESSAIEHWSAAARAGHASAADALADALESDVWRELADVDPFARRQV
jgi:hypothetical protein